MSGSANPADVQKAMVGVLAPYIGESLAASSTRMYMAKLGNVAAIGPSEAKQLVGWVAPGLKVFVGDARTKDVTAQLEKALAVLVNGAGAR